MFQYSNVKTVTFNIADPTSDHVYPFWKVSSRMSHIEILESWAVSDTTVTCGAGPGVALSLLDYGAAGTENVGTVTAVLGSTAVVDTWTSVIPKDFTISEGTFTGGHYLCLKYDEEGSVAALNITIGINYVEGAAA
jgi:hypothetical protein